MNEDSGEFSDGDSGLDEFEESRDDRHSRAPTKKVRYYSKSSFPE
jgi:hypothetical protein